MLLNIDNFLKFQLVHLGMCVKKLTCLTVVSSGHGRANKC